MWSVSVCLQQDAHAHRFFCRRSFLLSCSDTVNPLARLQAWQPRAAAAAGGNACACSRAHCQVSQAWPYASLVCSILLAGPMCALGLLAARSQHGTWQRWRSQPAALGYQRCTKWHAVQHGATALAAAWCIINFIMAMNAAALLAPHTGATLALAAHRAAHATMLILAFFLPLHPTRRQLHFPCSVWLLRLTGDGRACLWHHAQHAGGCCCAPCAPLGSGRLTVWALTRHSPTATANARAQASAEAVLSAGCSYNA